MPKRANPFLDDFIPQSKVHVNIKQFNNNDDRLKKVYEKTLELLFKGAKKIPSSDALNNNETHFTKKEEKMKQLFIGIDGSLQRSGCMKEPNAGTRACDCGATAESRCAYCEAALCGACERACPRCERAHCQRCVLLGSGGSEVCVSCYG